MSDVGESVFIEVLVGHTRSMLKMKFLPKQG